MINIKETFKKYEDEYLNFTPTEGNSKRGDLSAFMLLDRLVPDDRDLISSSEHDEIFLNIDCSKLAEVASEEDILFLVRCGILYNDTYDCLAMTV